MINSIQALRFIFAIFILCEHFPIDADHPHLIPGAGPMGVSFFLVLSGFVMSIGYEDRVKAPTFNWKDFMIRRLIRLWPLHLLCLGVWIILAYGAWGSNAIHPLPLLGNALLFQWLPIEHIGGNGVAWCLSVLVIFYAVYPLLARLKSRHLLLTAATFSIGLLLLEPICPTEKIYWYWYISPFNRIVDFILGMLCYHSYRHLIQRNVGAAWSSLPSVCCWLFELLPIILLYSSTSHPAGKRHALCFGCILLRTQLPDNFSLCNIIQLSQQDMFIQHHRPPLASLPGTNQLQLLHDTQLGYPLRKADLDANSSRGRMGTKTHHHVRHGGRAKYSHQSLLRGSNRELPI